MIDEELQDPTKPQTPTTLEATLGTQANEAIKAGADPKAVTDRLGIMVRHIRANPDVASHGQQAIEQGADPGAVTGRVWQLAQNDSPASAGPGFISRGLSSLKNAATHPIETAENIVTGPIKSALTSARFAAEQDAENAVAMSTGRTGVGERTVTPKQAAQADLQTFANIASPSIFRGAKLAAGMIPKIGGKIATGTALAATGAATGAASNLNDPAAGAVAGGIAAPVMGGAIRGVTNLATRPNILTTGIRSKFAMDPTERLPLMDAARDKAANPLYDKFRALGDLGRSPELDELAGTPNQHGGVDNGLPVVRRAFDTVKGESPELAKLPDSDARVLDAVYKRVGDKAWRALHGFETADAQRALFSAIDNLAQAKGGSYADPVNTFKEHSQNIDAVTRGKDALENELSVGGGSEDAAINKSPTALRLWNDEPARTPTQTELARQSMLGQIGRRGVLARVPKISAPLPLPSAALLKGNKILKSLSPEAPQTTEQILQLLGIPAATISNTP